VHVWYSVWEHVPVVHVAAPNVQPKMPHWQVVDPGHWLLLVHEPPPQL
jgi:hypothetical protein